MESRSKHRYEEPIVDVADELVSDVRMCHLQTGR